MIDVTHVYKYFREETALQDLDVHVGKGEIYGFLGPSGSGKTTTIHLLTGQMKPDIGSVTVMGKTGDQLKQPDFLQRIGVMTEATGLYQRLSVMDNLKLAADLYGVKAPEKRINELLALTGLTEASRKRADKLSKGMMQRVLLIRALLHEPELLFLDEPTAALDPASTKKIHEALLEQKENGVTIFLTTHDMEEAEALCDRVAFLHHGSIQKSGVPKELRREHADGSISVELQDGRRYRLIQDEKHADRLAGWMKTGSIAAIQTNVPTLGDIFIEVTGRELV
ncbi:ABC transporter ATP-binding protein [Alkalicoccus chagannorensis]|uniref:ABC transporter ATP-binding protein n=1 Tax=Alkalicoccus chagannorensis TaxID=427072 RepID=UPI00047B3ED6|nr:ABC transporter ATP-binding protein [Alkalicoccus chagannorensis]